jgi:hypothetical protein
LVRRFPDPKITKFESPLSDRPAFFWLFTGGGIDGFITIFDDRLTLLGLFTGEGIGGFFSLGGDRFFGIYLGTLGYSLDEECLICLQDGDESRAGESVGFCQLCKLDIPVWNAPATPEAHGFVYFSISYPGLNWDDFWSQRIITPNTPCSYFDITGSGVVIG